MSRKLSIIILLFATAFLPSVATAQLSVFAKHKVVIADVIDRNDRPLNPAIIKLILQGYRDMISSSEDYEVFEVNLNDVKNRLETKGLTPNPANISKEIGKQADFIVFTTVKSSSSAIGSQSSNVTIFISTSLYRISTASEVLADQDKANPTEQSLLSVSSALISRMLGLKNQSRAQYAQQSTTQSSQQHFSNSDTGDVRFYNGAIGVVVVLYDETGKHGLLISANQNICNWDNAKTWSSNLGAGWHLPSSSELNLIYKNKNKINHILSQKGFNELDDSYYWTNDVTISGTICIISMFNGSSTYFDKSRLGLVRAVATF